MFYLSFGSLLCPFFIFVIIFQKHLGQKLAEFRVVLEARWSKGGEFEDYFEGSRDDGVNKPIEDIMEQGDSGSDFEENRDDEEENVRKPTDEVMEKADSGSDFEE